MDLASSFSKKDCDNFLFPTTVSILDSMSIATSNLLGHEFRTAELKELGALALTHSSCGPRNNSNLARGKLKTLHSLLDISSNSQGKIQLDYRHRDTVMQDCFLTQFP